MKTAFYPKLAFDGIKKNKKMYIPYIATSVLSVAMLYIMRYLTLSSFIKSLPKMITLLEIVGLGSFVIAIFSAIFLFYTNSFLIKGRKREFGLYSILGMNKGKIGKILFFETVIVYLISTVLGLVFGMLFSKLCELILIRLVNEKIVYTFSVSGKAISDTVGIFAVIFVLLLLNTIRQIRFSSALNLVKSDNFGEKPPKANFVFGILGFLLLAGAYFIAVRIENPVDALMIFFVAVIMVIIGSYLVFISGSVMLCKILQKNKKYYYKKNHFISVSSMAYRMKRNGAGLATICILLTMVLVMISSTSCLFFGAEDSLKARYPKDISATIGYNNFENATEKSVEQYRNLITSICEKYNAEIIDSYDYREAFVSGLIQKNGDVQIDSGVASSVDYSSLITVHFVPLSDYNRSENTDIKLNDGEAIAYTTLKYKVPDKVNVGGVKLKITEKLEKMDIDGSSTAEVFPNLYLVVNDVAKTCKPIAEKIDGTGDLMLQCNWRYGFNTNANEETQGKITIDATNDIFEITDGKEAFYYKVDALAVERNDFYATYGGFFFLGIMLSVLFLVAAVLIIYYKQISEGFEDAGRFGIMMKVGMTKKDIKKSINSQMLTVFYLPLVFAVMHMCFAFPLVRKVLLLFGIMNLWLLIITTAISVVIFGLFYLFVYKMTSNVYYKLVSENK